MTIISLIVSFSYIIYNVIIFAILGIAGHGVSFWIPWFFSLITFLLVLGVFVFSSHFVKNPKTWIYDYPIFRKTVIFYILSLAIELVLVLFNTIIPPILSFLIPFCILGAYLIFLLVSILNKKISKGVLDSEREELAFIEKLRCDLKKISTLDDRKEFKELCDMVLYSDPRSCKESKMVEKEITSKVEGLSKQLSTYGEDDISHICLELKRLLLERNNIVKLYK